MVNSRNKSSFLAVVPLARCRNAGRTQPRQDAISAKIFSSSLPCFPQVYHLGLPKIFDLARGSSGVMQGQFLSSLRHASVTSLGGSSRCSVFRQRRVVVVLSSIPPTMFKNVFISVRIQNLLCLGAASASCENRTGVSSFRQPAPIWPGGISFAPSLCAISPLVRLAVIDR